MRALFVADVHISNALPYARRDPETLISDRIQDTINVLDVMGMYAQDKGIRYVFVLGDLVDKRLMDAVTAKLTAAAISRLTALGLTVFIVPGNHEAYDAQSRHFIVDAYRQMDVIVAESDSTRWDVEGVRFVAIPYQPVDRVRAVLAKGGDVLLLHQTIRGAMQGDWRSPDGVEPEYLDAYPLVLAGHFHTPQSINPKVRYLGAPLQHNFGDAGQRRGFWDIKFGKGGGGSVQVEPLMVPIDAPRFAETTWGDGPFPAAEYIRCRVEGATTQEVNRALKKAEEACRDAVRQGARYARAIPAIPQATTKQRLATSATQARASWPRAVADYLDCFDLSGFDREKLQTLGQELIQEAAG